MSEPRRAAVMLIQRGDPEIGGALMRGVIAGRAGVVRGTRTSSVTADAAPPSPQGIARAPRAQAPRAPRMRWEGFGEPVESVEIVTVETDKWRRVARQVRIAVGNDKTAEDYRLMIIKARGDYAVHRRTGPAHAVARKVLLAWVMLCQGIRRAYRAQEKVLGNQR